MAFVADYGSSTVLERSCVTNTSTFLVPGGCWVMCGRLARRTDRASSIQHPGERVHLASCILYPGGSRPSALHPAVEQHLARVDERVSLESVREGIGLLYGPGCILPGPPADLVEDS